MEISFTNGISLELAMRGDEFMGVGAVRAHGTSLRSPRRPMFVDIRSPDGVELRNYTITAHTATDDRVSLTFAMERKAGGLMEWMVHEVRGRYNTADWTLPPEPATDTQLQLAIAAVERTLGDAAFVGYRYQYRYHSADLPIYKILDRGTWEIGGAATGNELWMRQGNIAPVFTVRSPNDWYSTEWYLPSADNPNVFQFFPLQTQLQGFTFTASEAGVLVTWPTEVAHVRTLIEKRRGSDEIVHWHEHCGDLAHEFATAPVEVLWSPGKRSRAEVINVYEHVRQQVWTALHAQIGMRPERVTTYGVFEEWNDADLQYYTAQGVPKLLDAGVKTIFLCNHFENNMNVYGVSNMCCTVDYKVAETVGEARLRRLCDTANAGGALVEMWGNTSLSTLTTQFHNRNGKQKRVDFLPREDGIMAALDEAEAPFVRNASNAIEADHYTPVFAVLNLRDPVVRAYWHQCWQAAHDKIGLGAIFLDSSFNLSSDKFHYQANTRSTQTGATIDQTALLGNGRPGVEPAAAILSQYRAHLDLMREMQAYGYVYCGEDTGVFGISRSGPDAVFRLDNLWMWAECLADFDVPALQAAAADPDEIFFRGLAYRMMWKLYWNIATDQLSWNYSSWRGTWDTPTAWQLALLRAFNTVTDLMINRTLLPDETGVVYRSGDRQVLWAFADTTLPLRALSHIHDVLGGQTSVAGAVTAHQHHVYLIEPHADAP